MTRKEFLKELKALRKKWTLEGGVSFLRCEKGDCPILAVVRTKTEELQQNNFLAVEYGKTFLKLSPGVINDIIVAADDDGAYLSPKLRKFQKVLFKAAGVKPHA